MDFRVFWIALMHKLSTCISTHEPLISVHMKDYRRTVFNLCSSLCLDEQNFLLKASVVIEHRWIEKVSTVISKAPHHDSPRPATGLGLFSYHQSNLRTSVACHGTNQGTIHSSAHGTSPPIDLTPFLNILGLFVIRSYIAAMQLMGSSAS